MFDIEILKRDGTKIDLRDHKVFVQDVIVSSIQQDNNFSTQEGKNGREYNGSVDRLRTITAPFFTYDKYLHNFTLIRDEIFSLFGKEEFWIREKREGKYVSGKQYLVKLTNVIELKQQYKFSTHSLVFETTDLPYGQSILTTQEIQSRGLSINDESWGHGMGLQTTNDNEMIYTHKAIVGETFPIYNAGNVDVHPFESHLLLTIRNVIGANTRFQLTNLTNASRLRINTEVLSDDIWRYDGPSITCNQLAAIKDTRKDFVHLSSGWNIFQIYYCDSATIEFDFNYLYR